jgi:hypothetical protein
MEPMAAVVAGPEPESEAKNIQEKIVTTAYPPDTNPAKAWITFMIFSVTPVLSIIFPANMNPGIAINGKISAPEKKVSAINTRGIVVKKRPTRAEIPREIPMGIPKIREAVRVPNRIKVIEYSPMTRPLSEIFLR